MPANGDTLYFTGSTTKAFTAAAAGNLVFDNDTELKWSSKMADFLREDFVLSDNYYTSHITLEDALSHRSGLPRHDFSYGPGSLKSVVRSMRYLPVTAEPRTKWQYCNIMYASVGYLVETITGKDLESILKRWFWEPLGMQSTFFSISDAVDASKRDSSKQLARGYHWVYGSQAQQEDQAEGEDVERAGGYYVPEPYLDISGLAGAGATISSVNDYSLWIRALLQAADRSSSQNSSSPVFYQLYRQLMSPRTIVNADEITSSPYGKVFITPPDYALGWLTQTLFNHVLVSHGGGLTGFGTELYLLPEDGFGVVTMGNTALTSNIAGQYVALSILAKRLKSSKSDFEAAFQYVQNKGSITGLSPQHFCLGCGVHRGTDSDIETRVPPDSSNIYESFQPTDKVNAPKGLEQFCGIYSHPAYGKFNVTRRGCSHSRSILNKSDNNCKGTHDSWKPKNRLADKSSSCLHLQPSPKLWSAEIVLEPRGSGDIKSAFFNAVMWQPHGPHASDAIIGTVPTCEAHDGSINTNAIGGGADATCRDTIAWTRDSSPSLAYFESSPDGLVERLGIELEPEMVSAAEEDSKGRSYDWRKGMIWFDREQ